MKQTLKDYRALPYSRRSERMHEDDGSSYWVAWIHELPGCKTDGTTQAEAMLNLDTAFDDYIEAMIEFAAEIPVPKSRPKPKSRDDIIWSTILDPPKMIVPTQEEFEKRKAMPIEGTIKDIEVVEKHIEKTVGTAQSVIFVHEAKGRSSKGLMATASL